MIGNEMCINVYEMCTKRGGLGVQDVHEPMKVNKTVDVYTFLW